MPLFLIDASPMTSNISNISTGDHSNNRACCCSISDPIEKSPHCQWSGYWQILGAFALESTSNHLWFLGALESTSIIVRFTFHINIPICNFPLAISLSPLILGSYALTSASTCWIALEFQNEDEVTKHFTNRTWSSITPTIQLQNNFW